MCEIAHRWYSQTLFTRKSTIFLVVDVVYYFAFLCSQYRLFFLFMIFLIRSHTLLRLAFVSRNFLCSLILLMFILSIQCHDILMLLYYHRHCILFRLLFFSIQKLPHATHSTKRKHVECVQNLFCIFIQSFAARLPFSETDFDQQWRWWCKYQSL